MATYLIQTEQSFSVSYAVEADSPEEAWEELIDANGIAHCEDQSPNEITGEFDTSYIRLDDDDLA